MGVSEETDSFTVVVSEETGTVSTTKNGEIIRGISGDRLKAELYGMQAVAEKNKGRLFLKKRGKQV